MESAIITGSFLFIAQAVDSSTAEKNAAALYNTSTVVNAAFTATVASVFQSWLADTTSAYVNQFVTGLTAAQIRTTNEVRLALFSAVTQPDVQVLDSTIDWNITAQLVENGTASPQSYAYNVTLQVTVLTVELLSSVFVSVLHSTSSRRHLLAHTVVPANQLDLQHSSIEPGSAWQAETAGNASVTMSETEAHSSSSTGSGSAVYTDSSRSSSSINSDIRMYSGSNQSSLQCKSSKIEHVYNSSSKSSQCSSGSGGRVYNGSVRSSTCNSNSRYYVHSSSSASSRRLQATQSSFAFPLASLLLFKMDLTLAAFQGTSGCSTVAIADLFYNGADVPATLSQLCGDSDADLSLSEALLALANSSIPLFQVPHCCITLLYHCRTAVSLCEHALHACHHWLRYGGLAPATTFRWQRPVPLFKQLFCPARDDLTLLYEIPVVI